MSQRHAPLFFYRLLNLLLVLASALSFVSARSDPNALTGPIAGPSYIDPDTVDLWTDIPAVQLGRQFPHRWKSFLPSAGVVPARSRRVKEHLKDLDDSHSSDASKSRSVDADERPTTQRISHVASEEAKGVWESAKQAAHVVAHPSQPGTTSSTIQILPLIKAFFRWTRATAVHTVRLIGLTARLAWRGVRLAASSSIAALRLAGRAFLFCWSTIKYMVRQILRPVRVVVAPLVYIWLGIKWTFWDVPSYYIYMVLKEVYPLYVFCGAALALGTAIGLVCALVLWIGSTALRSTSPLEANIDSLRDASNVMNRRMDFERNNEKMLKALMLNNASSPSGLKVKGKGKTVARRSTASRRRRSIDRETSPSIATVSNGGRHDATDYPPGPGGELRQRSASLGAPSNHRRQSWPNNAGDPSPSGRVSQAAPGLQARHTSSPLDEVAHGQGDYFSIGRAGSASAHTSPGPGSHFPAGTTSRRSRTPREQFTGVASGANPPLETSYSGTMTMSPSNGYSMQSPEISMSSRRRRGAAGVIVG